MKDISSIVTSSYFLIREIEEKVGKAIDIQQISFYNLEREIGEICVYYGDTWITYLSQVEKDPKPAKKRPKQIGH